jgi:nitrate reductase gamma subunit
MDDAPTTYIIPKYLTARARRLRWAARTHLFAMPLALWLPLLVGLRGVHAVSVAAPILAVLLALPQLAPLGAPRTMRRRYRRLTGQADLIVLAGFSLLALAIAAGTRLSIVALGTLGLAVPVAAFLLLSPSVYLIPHPEDVQRP